MKNETIHKKNNQKIDESKISDNKQVETGIDLDESTQDLDEYIKEINEYLKNEQQNYTIEEDIIEVELKKIKKVSTIEREENKDQYLEAFIPNKNNVIEVKDKLFKLNEEMPKEVYYNGKIFIKDRHQG